MRRLRRKQKLLKRLVPKPKRGQKPLEKEMLKKEKK